MINISYKSNIKVSNFDTDFTVQNVKNVIYWNNNFKNILHILISTFSNEVIKILIKKLSHHITLDIIWYFSFLITSEIDILKQECKCSNYNVSIIFISNKMK